MGVPIDPASGGVFDVGEGFVGLGVENGGAEGLVIDNSDGAVASL
jgi:hypothetical protein